MHRLWPLLLGCALFTSFARAALPDAPSGLTCTAPSGAIVRLNLDLGARRFQKEGFPILPVRKISDRIIVLMRAATATLSVEAVIDRRTLVYTARSEDLTTRQVARMDYRCVAGPPFATADRQ